MFKVNGTVSFVHMAELQAATDMRIWVETLLTSLILLCSQDMQFVALFLASSYNDCDMRAHTYLC